MSTAANKRVSIYSKIYNAIKHNIAGFLFISPVLIGIAVFTLWPLLTSAYYSFFDYNVISEPQNFGLQNYILPFTREFKNFSKSISVTFTYSAIAIPLSIFLAFSLAMLLNSRFRGIKIFQVLYYIPVIIPAVIGGLLWRTVFDVKYGIANAILTGWGLPAGTFLSSSKTAMPTFIMLGLFGIGGSCILFLASLKNIPESLYESADIEGASFMTKTIKITVPMCTPVIFYGLISGIIGSLQTFGGVFILTGGRPGPNNSLFFYVFNIYIQAFSSFKMGYASALSWLLFITISLLTLIIFKTSKWVFYGENS